jgi:hypothetical protein
MCWMTKESRLDSQQEQVIFLFSIASRPALGATQSPIQCVPGAVSPGIKWQEHEADHLPLSSAVIKNVGAIPNLLSIGTPVLLRSLQVLK